MNVSVVIPAYNASASLPRAIEAVLSQTLRAREIMVVDDGSVDGTGEVCRQYGAAVRYIRQANAGASAARNRGIAEAEGEWIAFQDADDEWLPHRLERQGEVLSSHRDLRWCACNCECVTGTERTARAIPSSVWTTFQNGCGIVRYFAAAAKRVRMQTSGIVIHRSVFTEVGMFDEKLKVCQDRDLWWRIAMRHSAIGYVAEVCYRWYLDTPGSLTKGKENRTVELGNVCDNLRRSVAAGAETYRMFYPFAKLLVMDYLIRYELGAVLLDSCAVREACVAIGLSPLKRMLLSSLRVIPRALGERLCRRLSV